MEKESKFFFFYWSEKEFIGTILLEDFQKRKGWKGHYEKEMADSPGADVCSLPVWDDDFLCNG